jgi:hypothetical protein
MALAVNGSGTIFKKCDRSNHRPDSNKGCASSTCQHTCDSPDRCPHAWTLRYGRLGAKFPGIVAAGVSIRRWRLRSGSEGRLRTGP